MIGKGSIEGVSRWKVGWKQRKDKKKKVRRKGRKR
jgi:hypothetical protein